MQNLYKYSLIKPPSFPRGKQALPIIGSDFNSPPTIEVFITIFLTRVGKIDKACLSNLTDIPAKIQCKTFQNVNSFLFTHLPLLSLTPLNLPTLSSSPSPSTPMLPLLPFVLFLQVIYLRVLRSASAWGAVAAAPAGELHCLGEVCAC